MAASVRAYLLIETQAGTSNTVLDGLKSLDQPVQVDRVQWLTQLEHDEVGRIDDVVDRASTRAAQLLL